MWEIGGRISHVDSLPLISTRHFTTSRQSLINLVKRRVSTPFMANGALTSFGATWDLLQMHRNEGQSVSQLGTMIKVQHKEVSVIGREGKDEKYSLCVFNELRPQVARAFTFPLKQQMYSKQKKKSGSSSYMALMFIYSFIFFFFFALFCKQQIRQNNPNHNQAATFLPPLKHTSV